MNNNYAFLKRLYQIALVVVLFTGFGNMPIYKRYYISALPGLGWASDFYINLYVHYIFGALLLGLAVFFGLTYLKRPTTKYRLTATGTLRTGVFGISLMTGILLAIRNLSQVNFSLTSQMSVAFIHLAMAMILVVLSIGCGVVKSSWIRQK